MMVMNRQGKVRLSRFWSATSLTERRRVEAELSHLVLARLPEDATVLAWKGLLLVYKRCATALVSPWTEYSNSLP